MATFQPMALGVRQPDIESPLNAMVKVQQMRGLQQQESLNQMKMDEYRRGVQQQEALNQMLQSGVSDTRLLGQGESGRAAYKAIGDEKTREQTARKTAAELIDNRLKRSREMLSFVRTPDQYMNWLTGELQDPVLGPQLKAIGVDPATIAADLQKALQQPGGFESFVQQSALAVDKFAEMNKPQIISQDTGTGGHALRVYPMGGPASVVPGSEFVKTEPPPKPTTDMLNYEAGKKDPNFAARQIALKRAGASSTTVKLPAQENEFEKELGKTQAKALVEGRTSAEDARAVIENVHAGRQILDSGMVTGFGADAIVGVGQALKQVGIDFGGDATANAQAYTANMAQNVGKLIKQFGAGTGLSDADRAYAEKMAGGKITLDEKAIRKILDINERGARNIIKLQNKKAEGIKTNIPLTVDMPSEYQPASKPGSKGVTKPAAVAPNIEALLKKY